MFNFIQADLYRLAHKKSNYAFYGILFSLFVVAVILLQTSSPESEGISNAYIELGVFLLSQAFPLFFGLQAYSTVYINDISSSSHQNIFSSGLSKTEFVIGKFITFVIYLFTTFLIGAIVFFALFFFLTLSTGAQFDTGNLSNLAVVGVTIFLGMIGYAAVANMVSFISQNTTVSLITFGVLISNISLTALDLISLATDKLEFLRKLTLSYYINHTNQSVIAGFLPEMPSNAEPLVTWGVTVLYIVVASIVGILILSRIEIKEGK